MTVTFVPGGTGFRPACGSSSMGEVASEVERMKDGGGAPGAAAPACCSDDDIRLHLYLYTLIGGARRSPFSAFSRTGS